MFLRPAWNLVVQTLTHIIWRRKSNKTKPNLNDDDDNDNDNNNDGDDGR